MRKAAVVVIGAAAGVGAWLAQNWQPQALDNITTAVENAIGSVMPYTISINLEKNRKYVNALRVAQQKYGIPPDILVAQAWTESRFNPRAVSPVGAAGIMQFMPATAKEMGIDPFDPFASIDAAGRYMQRLYKALGTWEKAIAAYNWGIGNVQRKGMEKAPAETRNYVASITQNSGVQTA